MLKAQMTLDKDFIIGDIDERLFGSFIEHIGRGIYTGLYEPDHPNADKNGFRKDVIELIKELRVPVVRYPGGNFVSGYKWEDGIGPRAKRPHRLDLAWRSIETNQFGLDDFITWCKTVGTEPMMAINLGSRGLEEAMQIMEYCNHPQGTFSSNLRIQNGHKDPHDIKLWCLGNEMDGPWQIGHKTAEEYGRIANEVAHVAKLIDPAIELVAAGSSNPRMTTFPQWEATVLDACYDKVDYISLHIYFDNFEDDISTFLAKSTSMDGFIDTIAGTCDYVKAKKRSKKQVDISFDEWNVWFHSREKDKETEPWQVAPPIIEDSYTFEDALVVGCMINSLLRHADRVKIGCLAQLVNVIAPIMTQPGGPAWRQTIFYPFYYALRYGRGKSMKVAFNSPGYETKDFGLVPYLDTVATYDETAGTLALFAVNRSQTEELTIQTRLGAFHNISAQEHIYLAGFDPKAINSMEQPENVIPKKRSLEGRSIEDNLLTITLPPLSWNVITLQTAPRA